jgi:tRNA 5-methylaminomethyl-2-thiouridine biosynthesis bifunctional protein
MHFVGAHYSHKDDELTPRTADTTEIMSNNSEWLPTLSLRNAETRNPRVCFRTSTIDRLPYIGALPDYTLFQQQATQYRSGTHVASKVACEPIPGIFVNVGHGSRGLLSCPIGGEIIARQIAHEPLADLADVAEVTSPQRLPMRLHKTSNAQGI